MTPNQIRNHVVLAHGRYYFGQDWDGVRRFCCNEEAAEPFTREQAAQIDDMYVGAAVSIWPLSRAQRMALKRSA